MNLYNDEYYRKIIEEESPFANRLAQYLSKLFGNKKVLDLGCGPGIFTEALRKLYVNCIGIDSSICMPIGAHYRRASLDLFIDEADYGICLEVLEHIPEESSDTVVADIAGSVPWLLLSAAHPGQGGVGHVNCQPKSYWLKKFCRVGMYYCPEETEQLMDYIKQGPYMGWFLMNGMILRRM